jgi:DNA-binding beta-propeller fold protein YncE
MADSFEVTARARRSLARGARTLAAAFAGVALASACSNDDGGGSYTVSAAGSGGGGTGGGPTGPTGSIQVLADDAERLLGPTTAAMRGSIFDFPNFWVVNGQLSGLFGGAPAKLPFSAVSVSQGGGVSATEITLDGDFYPHGIATGGDGTLYIGSVALNTVVRVPANSTTPEPFLAAGVAMAGVIGMKVDYDRGLLWLCDSDPRDMPRTGAVVGVSLDDGSEVVRHVLAAPDADSLFCNDLAIAYDGSVWATESIAGIIYRIDAADVMTPDSAEIWMRGGPAAPPAGGFGPSGLMLAGNTLFVANAGSGSLFVVDTTSDDPVADARALTLREGDKTGVSLCGPDGLLETLGPTDGADLIVVENGDCTAATPRVVRIWLDQFSLDD